MGVISDSDKQLWCSDGDQSLTGICFRVDLQVKGIKLAERRNREWSQGIFIFKMGKHIFIADVKDPIEVALIINIH